MSTEQTETPEWGAAAPPPPARKKWTVKRTVIAVAIAVGIAGAGGAAIYAASGSVTAGQGPGGGGGMVIAGPGPMGDLDHGQFQSGEVTAVSDTSITAKSEDGYTKTYTIDGDTTKTGDIAKGDDVTIMADADGLAKTIMTDDAMGPRRGDGGGAPPNGGGPNGNGPQNGN